MKLTKEQYENLIHNCALVYNAVDRDTYMKFHENVNKSAWWRLLQVKHSTEAYSLIEAFHWESSPQKFEYWERVHEKLMADEQKS